MTNDCQKDVEIVLNVQHGGFSISEWAKCQLKSSGNYDDLRYDRTNIELINLIKHYGSKKVSGEYAFLVIEYIPVEYFKLNCFSIYEYDGKESVHLHNDLFQIIKIKKIIKNDEMSPYEKIEQLKTYVESISKHHMNTNAIEHINNGWESLLDTRGVTFYYNYITGEETYVCPKNLKYHTLNNVIIK